jgi:hypothetical protein
LYFNCGQYYKVLIGGIDAATAQLALDITDFTNTFAPAVSTENFLKTMLDVGVGVLGVFNAGVGFFAGVAKAGLFDGKLLDKGTSGIVAATAGAVTAAKDNLPAYFITSPVVFIDLSSTLEY